jgi:hypothetical protein
LRASDIDAGFEYNNYVASASLPDIRRFKAAPVDREQSRYVLEFQPDPSERVLARIPCGVWLPPSPRELYLVDRDTASIYAAVLGGNGPRTAP